MAVVQSTTRVGPHGTTMKPVGSFVGKAAEAAGGSVAIIMQNSDQYGGGTMLTGGKKQ